MLKLKERKSQYKQLDENQINTEFERLDAIKKSQSDLGLGKPTTAINNLSERLRLSQFAKEFTPVEKPDFTAFVGVGSELNIQGKSSWDNVEILPDKALALLTGSSEKLVVRVNSVYMSAPIPLIPTPIQDRAARAKEIIPSVKFHMAFVPQWTFDPKADPILLAEVAGEYFRVGAWSGDVDVLSEYIVDKL